MTSFLISAFKSKADNAEKQQMLKRNTLREGCTFCAIARGELPAYKVYEDDNAVAFLDILPIRRGHLLLIPKEHHARVTDMPTRVSAGVAAVLPLVCRALCKAVEQPDFNIVSNNGYAQVVDHVHWHIVPAPRLSALVAPQPQPTETSGTPRSKAQLGIAELRQREELDDEDAEQLCAAIQQAVLEDKTSAKGSREPSRCSKAKL